jgi:uncharacterized membrane protein
MESDRPLDPEEERPAAQSPTPGDPAACSLSEWADGSSSAARPPADARRPSAPGLGPGLASLLPPDADDDEDVDGEAESGEVGHDTVRVAPRARETAEAAGVDKATAASEVDEANEVDEVDEANQVDEVDEANQAGAPRSAPRVSTVLGPLPATVRAGQTRDLNDVVHRILIIGLLLSTGLLLSGLLLDLLTGQALPAATLPPADAFQRVLELRPSGFLSLGLLALMFTPVVRVIGSTVVFLWERDWLYFGVTVFVFMVMLLSVILGRV